VGYERRVVGMLDRGGGFSVVFREGF
jgi:hypothetical protein